MNLAQTVFVKGQSGSLRTQRMMGMMVPATHAAFLAHLQQRSRQHTPTANNNITSSLPSPSSSPSSPAASAQQESVNTLKHIDVGTIKKFRDVQRVHSVIPATSLFDTMRAKLHEFSLPLEPLECEDAAALLRVLVHFGHTDTDMAVFLSGQLMTNVGRLSPRVLAVVFAACVEHATKLASINAAKSASSAAKNNSNNNNSGADAGEKVDSNENSAESTNSGGGSKVQLEKIIARVLVTAKNLRHHEFLYFITRLGEIGAAPQDVTLCQGRDIVSYASAAADIVAHLLPEAQQRIPALMPVHVSKLTLSVLPAVTLLGTRADVTDFFFAAEQRLATYVGEIDEGDLVKIVSVMQRRGLSVEMLSGALKQFKDTEQTMDSASDVQEILRALSAFGGSAAAAQTAGSSRAVQQVYLERAIKSMRNMDVVALTQLLAGMPSSVVVATDEAAGAGDDHHRGSMQDGSSSSSAGSGMTDGASASGSSAAAAAGGDAEDEAGNSGGSNAAMTAQAAVREVVNRLNTLLERAAVESTVTPIPLRVVLGVLRAAAGHFKSLGAVQQQSYYVPSLAAFTNNSNNSNSSSNNDSNNRDNVDHSPSTSLLANEGSSSSGNSQNLPIRALLHQVCNRCIKIALTQPAARIDDIAPFETAQLAVALRYVQPPSLELRQLVDRLVLRGLRGRFVTVSGVERVIFVCLLGKIPVHAGSLLQEAISNNPSMQSEILMALLQPSAAMALLCGLCQLQEPVYKDIFITVAKKMIEQPMFPIGAGHMDSVVELTTAMVQHRVVFPSLVNGLVDIVAGCAQLCSARDMALIAHNLATLGVREPQKLRKMAEVVLQEKPPHMGNTANLMMALCLAMPESPLVAQCCARIRVNAHTASIDDSVQVMHALSLLKGDALFNNTGNIAAVTAVVEQTTSCLNQLRKAQIAARSAAAAAAVAPRSNTPAHCVPSAASLLPRLSIQVLSTLLNAIGVFQGTMLLPAQLHSLLVALGQVLPSLIEAISAPAGITTSSAATIAKDVTLSSAPTTLEITSSKSSNSSNSTSTGNKVYLLDTGVAAITADQTIQLWSLFIMRLPGNTTVKADAVHHLVAAVRHYGAACSPAVLSSVSWALAEPMPIVGEQATDAVEALLPLLAGSKERAALLSGQQAIVALCSLRGLGLGAAQTPLLVASSGRVTHLIDRIVATERQWHGSAELIDRLTRAGLHDAVMDRIGEARIARHQQTMALQQQQQQDEKKKQAEKLIQQQQQQQQPADVGAIIQSEPQQQNSKAGMSLTSGATRPSTLTTTSAAVASSSLRHAAEGGKQSANKRGASWLVSEAAQSPLLDMDKVSNVNAYQEVARQLHQISVAKPKREEQRTAAAAVALPSAATAGGAAAGSTSDSQQSQPQQQQQQFATIIPEAMKGFSELCAIGGEEKVAQARAAPLVANHATMQQRLKAEHAAAAAASAEQQQKSKKNQQKKSSSPAPAPPVIAAELKSSVKKNTQNSDNSVQRRDSSPKGKSSSSSSSDKGRKSSPTKSLKANVKPKRK